ncbi:pantoate--beta-alanine ligase [Listeria kieliensis]
MQVVRSKRALKAILSQQVNKSIGFVPTMGYLHEGHLALMEKARLENEFVVASVFVNPTQFGPSEDLEAYPRDEEKDQKQSERAGVDLLFIPSVEEIYPKDVSAQIKAVQAVDVLDGKARPGHFDGVLTVLLKLFMLVQPDRAYFGQKDAQQVAVVQNFVSDYFLPVNIRVVETVREPDGLAKSSRNVNLLEEERKEAPVIHQALLAGKARILDGCQNEKEILDAVREVLRAATLKLDYLALYSYPDFKPVTDFTKPIILAIAVQYEKARLIDNEIVRVSGGETNATNDDVC